MSNYTTAPTNHPFNVLRQLGLTQYQAKVYLFLLRNSESSTKQIARLTSLNRGNVHVTLAKLHHLGLVEKIVDTPIKYKAAPAQDVVSLLITKRHDELREIKSAADKLIHQIEVNHNEDKDNEDKCRLTIVPGQRLLAKVEKTCMNVKNSIDSISSCKKFCSWLSLYPDVYSKALKRGAKIRLILDEPEPGYLIPEAMHNLMHQPAFTLRCTPTFPKAQLGVFDNKLATFFVSSSNQLAEAPCYFTENPSLVSVFKEYFEMLWLTSKETTTKEF